MNAKKKAQNAWIKDFEERMGYLPTYSILPDELKDEETMETKRYYTPPKRDQNEKDSYYLHRP